MVDLVSQAAEKAVPAAPLLELGGDGWLGAQVVPMSIRMTDI